MLWPPHWVLLSVASTRPQACLFTRRFSHSPEELITLLASDRIWREQTSTMFSPNTLPTYRSAHSMLLLSCLYPKALGYSYEQNRKKKYPFKNPHSCPYLRYPNLNIYTLSALPTWLLWKQTTTSA